MLTCSWSGSTAPGANRISAVIRPVARSNSSVLASQPEKAVCCHSMLSGRTRWEWLSAVWEPFGVAASMAMLRSNEPQGIIAALVASVSRPRGDVLRRAHVPYESAFGVDNRRMSASQNDGMCQPEVASLFDHLFGAGEKGGWD